ncbi:hypothetical protein BUALT_Bualt19G0008800 [Buddleja alternifolia]|uniref:Malectin-like domain-containing protein n=1 Tax=Buddleja alternifolia TaxID=168488 RepID=A0AAV6W1S1_9LAMI|nr:hypothetical protein BUALT_Bualt19G0008800 [Buddleja alternifolia]
MASHIITMTKFFSLLIFSLYISLSLPSLASAFSPTDHYLINCGSRAAETLDSDHRVFTGDERRFLTSTGTIQLENAAVSSSELYHTATAFNRPTRYAFPIRDLGIHHLVRLHFHPIYYRYNNLIEAEFHVIANGFLLLRNFRVPNSDDFPMIKEFVIPIDSEKLEITFLPSEKSKYGVVNAIEVISAPKDLIGDVAYVDSESSEMINGLLKTGFETVHRVNVGGFKVTPFNDSLWRTWVTDDAYLKSSGDDDSKNMEPIHFGGRIKYQIGGASREVGPDNVYNTARVIKSVNNSIPNTNMTFVFAVEKGHNYLVRLHFCDIASVALGMLYFNVYMNGNLAFENLDLTYATNSLLASPFYADLLVNMQDSEVLVVSVGPSNMSLPRAVDAILNGVEIWKTNNSMGSFDGEVCAESVWRVWRKEHVNVLLPLVAGVFLLLSAAMFIQKRRGGSVPWSRLPVDVSEDNLKFGNQFSSLKA